MGRVGPMGPVGLFTRGYLQGAVYRGLSIGLLVNAVYKRLFTRGCLQGAVYKRLVTRDCLQGTVYGFVYRTAYRTVYQQLE